MFRRKKIRPHVDEYIIRRYEDIAVCIHYDLKNGRGTYNYYAPWLELMLQRIPIAHVREKHSLMVKKSEAMLNAWAEEEEEEGGGAGPSGTAHEAVRRRTEGESGLQDDVDRTPLREAEAVSGVPGTHTLNQTQPTVPSHSRTQSRLCVIL